jgi:hypothetical protein
MGNVLQPSDYDALMRRVAALSPAAQPRWGRFTLNAMVCHLSESARMALDELPVRSKELRAFQVFPMKHLLLYVAPFPKNAPTAPELLAGSPAEFDAERSRLQQLMARIVAGAKDGPGPEHPLFGKLSRTEWGVVVYKHTDHHLRQFGA